MWQDIEFAMRQAKCLLLFDMGAQRLRDIVQRVLRQNSIEPVSLESEQTPGAAFVDQLFGLLRSSDFVIGDISRKNANVIFELGVAHGLGKPIVLLLSAKSDAAGIPSDLMGYQFLSYDPSDFSTFERRLNRVVASVASRLERGQ